MNSFLKVTTSALLGTAGLVGSVQAAQIDVTADIATSTTWTNDNTYNLTKQIYVLPGASLTIEPGTVIASDTGVGGALAITAGAQIFANGTKDAPIIFTSADDVATWDVDGSHPTGKAPQSGTWREAVNEWGNLTIMGRGYISENATPGNSATCAASNVAAMEGLIENFPGDPKILYGGGDDTDDSGVLNHVSLRYGGRVIGLNNELNGLSLGGVGSDTDIDYVEIMNNVDDGIEIWGGTVNLSHLSIWNIGDDSLDIDQGYRGKIQFGLIVQGYGDDAPQGSGVGDNCIEHDGAEDSNWQPVTTTTLYNMTVIGQPLDGDGGTAWRDNARVQHRNAIFMDLGEQLVRFDNDDGDGANGYGHDSTLSWADTWTTDWNAVPAHPNDCPVGTYATQTSGKLAEITDSVMYRNVAGNAYTEANIVGVFDAANNNVEAGFDPADQPITAITRGGLVTKGGKDMLPVTFLDPTPQNDALQSVGFSSGDDFFAPVKYRGAFAPESNWLVGWTAASAFGMTDQTSAFCDQGCALEGVNGNPLLSGVGDLSSGSAVEVNLRNAAPNAVAGLFLGFGGVEAPFKGGVLKALPFIQQPVLVVTNSNGEVLLPFTWVTGVPAGFEFVMQYGIQDTAAIKNVSLSNALKATTP